MPDKVLVRNVSPVAQRSGIWILQPGETAPVPVSVIPSFGGTVREVREELPHDSVTIYRSMCKAGCGHSLCDLTRKLTAALRDLGFAVNREDWRKDVDQPQIGHTWACNSASFETWSGKFSWPHPDADIAPRAHAAWLASHYTGHICSSRAVASALEASGIEPTACHVVNDAIDTDLFRPEGPGLDRWGDKFVLLMLGAMNPRKGFDVALEAYGRAFSARDDVVLVLKDYDYGWGRKGWCQEQVAAWRKRLGSEAPELCYVYETWGPEQIAAAYRRAAKRGAYFMPSRCEGFGLTGLEALACGCRLGATGWSGQLDYATPDNATLFPYTLSRNTHQAAAFEDDEDPQWADPDVPEMAAWMRRMYAEPPDVKLQQAISEAVRARFSFDRMAREFATAMQMEREGGSTVSPGAPRASLPSSVPTDRDETLGIGIPTRDRPGYVAALLGGLLSQTRLPDALCIVDDTGTARDDPAVKHLLALFVRRGVRCMVERGTNRGASPNHGVALEKLGTDLVLRLDDDLVPAQADFVERLYAKIAGNPEVGAVAGVYPQWSEPERQWAGAKGPERANTVADMLAGRVGLQFRNWRGGGDVVCCEHLYSSFMYRASYLREVGGFAECYSRFGQREESDASVRLHLLGKHALLVDTGAKCWHFLAGGGRRPEGSREAMRQDCETFIRRLAEWRRAR